MSADLSVVKTADKSLAVAVPLAPFEALSVEVVTARLAKIQEVMQTVMKEKVHYGKIDGCGDKPTLLKPGAEVLGVTFQLAARFDVEWVELPEGHLDCRVKSRIYTINGEQLVGEGVGSCTTMESKYRWRNTKKTCLKCGGPLRESKRDPEWYCWAAKGGCGATFPLNDPQIEAQKVGRAPNPDIADTKNTVLKMAKKRAHVDGILTTTGASAIFTQDIEDLPNYGDKTPPPSDPPPTEPPPASGNNAPPQEPAATPPKSRFTPDEIARREKILNLALEAARQACGKAEIDDDVKLHAKTTLATLLKELGKKGPQDVTHDEMDTFCATLVERMDLS